MSLPEDLLKVSARLANVPRTGAPLQADLRRAVSTAYYALFHKLVEAASLRFVGTHPDLEDLRRRVFGRSFEHGKMRKAAQAFVSSGPFAATRPSQEALDDPLWKALKGRPPSSDLQMIAEAFVDLMDARHQADYDTTARFNRARANALVARAESAIQMLDSMRAGDALELDVFLAALVLGRIARK